MLRQPLHCLYKFYICQRPKVAGSDYCLDHIKENESDGLKFCCMHDENAVKCDTEISQSEELYLCHSYCEKHIMATVACDKTEEQLISIDMAPETLSESEFVDDHETLDISNTNIGPEDQEVQYSSEDNEVYNSQYIISSSQSEYESDAESVTSYRPHERDNSFSTDALKHAAILTVEEVLRTICHKLMRLSHLYQKQITVLVHQLRELHRKFLLEEKYEKEQWGSQLHYDKKDEKFKIFEAMRRYHQHTGLGGEMRKKFNDLQLENEQTIRKNKLSKCVFIEGGVRCLERPLPLAKHCTQHILFDSKQVLFKACGSVIGEVECKAPVLRVFEGATCFYHMELRPYKTDTKDSEKVTNGSPAGDDTAAIQTAPCD